MRLGLPVSVADLPVFEVIKKMGNNNIEVGKKKRIIMAAEKIFASRGFYEAKVEDIAAAAGVGKGTVYEYFENKKELFREMLTSTLMEFFLAEKKKIDRTRGARQKLYCILKAHLDFLVENKHIAHLLLTDHSALNGEMHRWICAQRDEKLNNISLIIEEGIRQREIRRVDPQIAAKIFFGAVATVAGDIIMGQDINIEETTERVMDVFFRGVGKSDC